MKYLHNISFWIATYGKVGLWPKMPGTWGSLMALPLGAIISLSFGVKALLTATVFVFILGLISSYFVLFSTPDSDPSHIVIDEVAGQWLPLALAGIDLRLCGAAFVMFRLFDILKPPPIKQIEIYFEGGSRLSKATGIMVDDIVAGIYATICVALLKLTL